MADPLRALGLPVVPVEPRQEFAASLLRRLEHRTGQFTPGAATARYFVTDLDAAVSFYTSSSVSPRNCGQLPDSRCSTAATCGCC